MTKSDQLIDELRGMIAAKGGNLYGGEAITQEQHAMQCAYLAEQEGAPASLVAAALLHDIGHLMQHDFESAQDRGEDRFHENLGKKYLAEWFGPEVTEPVRLHVAAKRYLCATDGGYRAKLSAASEHTLKIQGGPMNEAEVAEFEANPQFHEAVRLRIWDDAGKDPELETKSLDYYLDIVRQVADAA